MRVAVDDVGSGFASFRHVTRVNPDILKLDRTLVCGIDDDPVRQSLASAIVAFAADVGAVVVSEGIENENELCCLKGLAVGCGQGFYLARPGLGAVEGEVRAAHARRLSLVGAGSRTARSGACSLTRGRAGQRLLNNSDSARSHPRPRRPRRHRRRDARHAARRRPRARAAGVAGGQPGPHSRSRLAGLLRPDVPEESARKTLRDAVYELRRAFAPAEPVVATRESVELRAEVDLAAFAAPRAGRLEDAARAAGYAGAVRGAAGAGGASGAAGAGGAATRAESAPAACSERSVARAQPE